MNKPAGLLVHRTLLDPREEQFVLQMARDQLGQRVYPVHRLDRPTSGVLLFAFTPEAARFLVAAFMERRVTKRYLLVVRGVVAQEGVIDHPLSDLPARFLPECGDGGERGAVTAYRRLATVELPVAVGRYPTSRYSLVEALPQTGRRHQLRRHFKHIFHPVIGDTNYGEGRHNRFFREELGCSRLLLHAAGLTFPRPADGREVSVTAPLDDAFSRVIGRLGWDAVSHSE
ncbi:MAG TPA: pseudouridine synthase [Geobacteraceae bacterium]|nr:pseudouridine synthase [Geobacteraceae bacterium]